jgi:hypothetical protein
MQPPDVYGSIQKPQNMGTPQMQKENLAQGSGGGDFERDGRSGSAMPQQ